MENLNNNIFNSKIFYEFFIFCVKNKIDFNFEIKEKSKIKYNSKKKNVIANLSKDDNEFKPKIIYDIWLKIINNIIIDVVEKNSLKKELDDLFKE
jgi:hypothetical protein